MTLDSYNEIVAMRFKRSQLGDVILFDPKECIARIELGEDAQMVSRMEMELMSQADLGPKWDKAAKAPTLFLKTDLETEQC